MTRLAFALVYCLLATSHSPGADPATVERVRQGWLRLETADKVPKSYTVIREVVVPKRTFKSEPRISIGTAGSSRVSKGSAVCWNSLYAFALKAQREGKGWVVRQVEVSPPDRNELVKAMLGNGHDFEELHPLSGWYYKCCSHYLEGGQLIFGEIVENGDTAIYKFTLSTRFDGKDNLPQDKYVGEMTLAVDSNYAIVASSMAKVVGGLPSATFRLNFQREIVGGKATKLVNSFDSVGEREILSFGQYDATSPDPTVFRLTHFGLPEPVGVVWDRPTPLYVWLFAGAAASAIIAVLLTRLYRHPKIVNSSGG